MVISCMNKATSRPDGITLLSALFWVLALLAIIGGIIMMVTSNAIIELIEEEGKDVPHEVIDLLDSLFIGISIILIIIGVLYIIAGWGLWTMKSWARLVAIILAIISVLNFPIGTILGIIILWYLFKPEIKEAFQ